MKARASSLAPLPPSPRRSRRYPGRTAAARAGDHRALAGATSPDSVSPNSALPSTTRLATSTPLCCGMLLPAIIAASPVGSNVLARCTPAEPPTAGSLVAMARAFSRSRSNASVCGKSGSGVPARMQSAMKVLATFSASRERARRPGRTCRLPGLTGSQHRRSRRCRAWPAGRRQCRSRTRPGAPGLGETPCRARRPPRASSARTSPSAWPRYPPCFILAPV